MKKAIATVAMLASWLVLAALLPAMVDGCAPCELTPPVYAAQSEDGTTGGDQDDQINPGIFVLVIVLVSIVVATVMLLRQSKPGLPEGYDDEPDDGTSEDQDTSSR